MSNRRSRGTTRSNARLSTASNQLRRYDPGTYVPAVVVPSWSRTVTIGFKANDATISIKLSELIPTGMLEVGFKAIIIKKMMVFAMPLSGVAPVVTLVPGIVGSNPQFRAAAQILGSSVSVGVEIPTDFQGPYPLSSDRVVAAVSCTSSFYFRLGCVFLS